MAPFLGSILFRFRVGLFSTESTCAGSQIGSHKNDLPSTKWQNIKQVYIVNPLNVPQKEIKVKKYCLWKLRTHKITIKKHAYSNI